MQQPSVLRKDPPSAIPLAPQAHLSRIEWGQKRRNVEQNLEDEAPSRSKEHRGLKSSLRKLGPTQRQAKSVRFRGGSEGSARFRPQGSTSVTTQSPSLREPETRVPDVDVTGWRPDHEPLESLPLASITSPPVDVEYVTIEPYVSVWFGEAETPAIEPVLPEPEGRAAGPHRDASWDHAHVHNASTSHSQTLRYAINELYLCNRT